MKKPQPYREAALKILPWICTRCAREFPPSNWELLCVYCHENEHARVEDAKAGGGKEKPKPTGTHRPLAGLAELLKKKR